MNVSDFQQLIKDKYKFDRYSAWGISLVAVFAGIYLIFYWKIGQFKTPSNCKFTLIWGSLLTLMGMSGLFVLRTKYKISVLHNAYSKELNLQKIKGLAEGLNGKAFDTRGSYIFLVYQKKWWNSSFVVYLFAGRNVIAVNVQSSGSAKGGFIDFGASKRLERKIVNMLA